MAAQARNYEMKKQIRRFYIPKYRMTSEEYSSNDLQKLVDNIVNYEKRTLFYTKEVPISLILTLVIMYFVLR